MNQTHLHLVITHLPIFGSLLGGFVLAYGLYSKTNQTKIAGYYLCIISSLGAGVAYLTGESAEETVEKIQGVAKDMIDQHEDFAQFALIALIISGLLSLYGLYLTMKESLLTNTIAIVVLVASLLSFGFAARTGYLGGQIRHTELGSKNVLRGQDVQNNEDKGNQDEDDDD